MVSEWTYRRPDEYAKQDVSSIVNMSMYIYTFFALLFLVFYNLSKKY
jgi:hypothetical protein